MYDINNRIDALIIVKIAGEGRNLTNPVCHPTEIEKRPLFFLFYLVVSSFSKKKLKTMTYGLF